jgi:hypothetical protein
MSKQVRYAGVYAGPSYGNPWAPSFEGFTSLREAETRFRERQETSGTWLLDVTELSVEQHGMITSVTEDSTYWPATTPQDTIELYAITVLANGEQYIDHEPFLRLSAGPRGGVVRERY